MSLWNNKTKSLLFPNRCPFCRAVIQIDEDFCKPCAKELPGAVYQRYAVGGFPCCAPLPYRDAYAAAVKRYKFGSKDSYTHALALLITRAAARTFDLDKIDAVTCVPNYQKKRRFRHAERLARECAVLTGIPYADLLEKHRKTAPQHTLKRTLRFQNVRGAYRVPQPDAVRDKRVLLIDDIVTTGNTLGECARMLKKHGCREVVCAAVCATII